MHVICDLPPPGDGSEVLSSGVQVREFKEVAFEDAVLDNDMFDIDVTISNSK